jgi:hypothetical protein
MSDTASQEQLIARLSGELRPVKRLASPAWRTALWLAAVAALGVPLTLGAHWSAFAARLMAAPDMWLSLAGAALTTILSAFAAFQTSIPGRSRAWALLPVPAVLLWIGASTAGCLRPWAIAVTIPEPPAHSMECIKYLLLVSLPLAALITWKLTRACPLRPGLTACLGGLASAGAAACLLAVIHPFDANALDLLAHLAGVALVVGLCRVFATRALRV